ncbi:MAG: hypothetical protein RL011_689 [Pseudomonadota bacterium]
MLKTMQIVALLMLSLACGGGAPKGAKVAGAPHEFDAICGIDDDNMSFRIYEGKGLLQSASFSAKSFECLRGDYTDVSSSLAWSCDEVGGGESHIDIRRNSTGAKQAAVKLDGPGSGTVQTLNCY